MMFNNPSGFLKGNMMAFTILLYDVSISAKLIGDGDKLQEISICPKCKISNSTVLLI